LLIRAIFGVILVSKAAGESLDFTHLKEFAGVFEKLLIIIGGLVKIGVRRMSNR